MNTMIYKGFQAQVMEANRLISDEICGLPPGSPLDVYYSDSFKSYPEYWMKGQGVYVIPVRPNKGIWFNFRMNDELNTAIIMTVKGCNPITGLPTSGFHLEKYENKCPKHGYDFQGDRYCPECDYKWPDRNYLSMSPLWWDGWFNNGGVRQFFFTEEMMRDIATAMIGKENTVPAFGFAFYSPKERRPETRTETRYLYQYGGLFDVKYSNDIHYLVPPNDSFGDSVKSLNINETKYFTSSSSIESKGLLSGKLSTAGSSLRSKGILNKSSAKLENMNATDLGAASNISDGGVDDQPTASVFLSQTNFVPEKEVAVGAGAKIRQSLNQDSYPLDSWKEKPDAVMTLYFVFQSEFEKMAAGGLKDMEGKKEGMLEGLPVG